MKRALLLCVLPLAACVSLLYEVHVTAVINAQPLTSEAPAFSAVGQRKAMTITGSITTPDPCYSFTASAETLRSVLTATVTAQPMPNALCIQVLGRFAYTLNLGDVPSDTWTLRVKHQIAQAEPVVAFETTVRVQ